ncbi:hypothetical protein LCGC14_2314880, partial [marine sediment metagenome]
HIANAGGQPALSNMLFCHNERLFVNRVEGGQVLDEPWTFVGADGFYHALRGNSYHIAADNNRFQDDLCVEVAAQVFRIYDRA